MRMHNHVVVCTCAQRAQLMGVAMMADKTTLFNIVGHASRF